VAHALSLLEPFIVAEVSRDESSLYVVDEWGIAHEDDVTGPWLRTSDRETGESSIKKYYAAARRESLVDHHYKEVGAALSRLLEESGARRTVVCAQHDIAAAFRRVLSSRAASSVVAAMPLDAASTLGQRVASARRAVEQARQEQLAALFGRIKEGLGPGGHGVAGFESVRDALDGGRLHTLLVERGYRPPGWRCGACSWVTLELALRCPRCGETMSSTMDAVGELVRRTILERGQLEVGERIEGLEGLGNLAGLLRYA
jgi:peptide subunit release factor 1 (eRF1)